MRFRAGATVLTIAVLASLPWVAHAGSAVDRVEVLDQALDAIEDGDDARYDELVEIALDLDEPFPTLLIEALVDRDSLMIDEFAAFLSLDDVEIIGWVIDTIDEEQLAIDATRRQPGPDQRADLSKIDHANAAYLIVMRQRGIEISAAVEKVMGLLPPPSSPIAPRPPDYATALSDLREQIGMPAPELGPRPLGESPQTLSPTTGDDSFGLNPIILIGIAVLGVAVGAIAVIRGRRHQSAAGIDGLTGLQTRRRFDLDLDERERRGAQPTGMLMIDVDDFKQFNDTHGHRMGDDVLRRVGDAISAHIRKIDVAYRYGGEEFVVILPDTRQEMAAAIAERVRVAITEIELPVQGRVTASVGVASGPSSDVSTTVHDADIALYAAKDAGRNRIALA